MVRRIIILMVRINHLFLVPGIILSLPPAVLFQQPLLFVAILAPVGFIGMLTRNRILASLASASLLGLIVWGKVASDVYHLPPLDSAILLLEFMVVIFLIEASNTAISFVLAYRQVQTKSDDISAQYRKVLTLWVNGQLYSLVRIATGAFGLSLGLLVVGDLVSISVNQVAFSGTLVLAAVVALLILLTYGREPEEFNRPRA